MHPFCSSDALVEMQQPAAFHARSGLPSFHLVSLGCPKNLVDSEGIAALLRRGGYDAAEDPGEADLLIVNTCGFIEPAREESRTVLRGLVQSRRPGQRIIAAGCYSQRCPTELAEAVPGIDGLIGTRCWMDVLDLVQQLDAAGDMSGPSDPLFYAPAAPSTSPDAPGIVRAAVQGTSAYLKLADGCRRSCAFCAIPLIKGTAVSRPPAAILADARLLADYGVQEIILIAQDTTDYGHDLGTEDGVAHMLDQLVREIPRVPWIRLMYAYPGCVTDRLIDIMAREPQILPYLDLPLQHAHPEILRRMRRPADIDRVRRTVEKLRRAMPEIAIRTTFLVGYPGESESQFRTLLEFAEAMRFDRVGVFTYSHEEGTPASELVDDVPPEVKEERRQRLMAVQQPISLAKNQALVGRRLDVLVEGQAEGLSVGRSYRDAPEVDGLVLVQAGLPVGEISSVRVTAALEYDLLGERA